MSDLFQLRIEFHTDQIGPNREVIEESVDKLVYYSPKGGAEQVKRLWYKEGQILMGCDNVPDPENLIAFVNSINRSFAGQ